MRGTSLQARLFISYVILVGIVIGVIAIGIVLSLTSSPILYRTITQRLRLASDVVALQLEDQPLVTLDSVYSYLYTVSAQTQLRVGLLTREEVILFDSGISLYPAFPDLDVPEERLSGYDLPVHTFRDEKGGVWFYTTKLLKGGYLVIVMATQQWSWKIVTFIMAPDRILYILSIMKPKKDVDGKRKMWNRPLQYVITCLT